MRISPAVRIRRSGVGRLRARRGNRAGDRPPRSMSAGSKPALACTSLARCVADAVGRSRCRRAVGQSARLQHACRRLLSGSAPRVVCAAPAGRRRPAGRSRRPTAATAGRRCPSGSSRSLDHESRRRKLHQVRCTSRLEGRFQFSTRRRRTASG